MRKAQVSTERPPDINHSPGLVCAFMSKWEKTFLQQFRTWCCSWLPASACPHRSFQKYRVAPRLGTLAVQRRLLRSLQSQTALP